MPEVVLVGCRPEPLASYLAALGVFRLVAEQTDPGVHGFWRDDQFVLRSRYGERELIEFFLHRYAPTPVVAPWNGASGFHPGDNRTGINAIESTDDGRFAAYRRAIDACRSVLVAMGLEGKPPKEDKDDLLVALRSALDDDALAWFDAALVLTDDGARFPPLLGTGGNDGHLDFTNNQMQRLTELLLAPAQDASVGWLRACLFGEPAARLQKGFAIGQFNPSAAGGANAGPGFDRDALVNPWQYVLMIEGALLFAAAATRRMESAGSGTLAYPFCVRSAGAGYASAARTDEANARHEIWLPLWTAPARLREIRALFGEGRAKVAGRSAATGVDFARAVATLGVDRGIGSFARYGFQLRNGLAYLATPLGRWRAWRDERVDLLAPLDDWIERFRRSADDRAPTSVVRALSALEDAILRMCRGESAVASADVLIALGSAEAALARSRRHTEDTHVKPVAPLGADWLTAADDSTPEFRLARSLASIGIREHLVPVRWARPYSWLDNDDRRTVWGDCDLVRNLIAVLRRRELDAEKGVAPPAWRPMPVAIGDIAAFIDGGIDEDRLEGLMRGLSLIDWPGGGLPAAPPGPRSPRTPALFGVLALAHHRAQVNAVLDVELKRTAGLLERAAAGDSIGAAALAVRRLRGVGLLTLFEGLQESHTRTRRIAAALLFPLSDGDVAGLAEALLQPATEEGTT